MFYSMIVFSLRLLKTSKIVLTDYSKAKELVGLLLSLSIRTAFVEYS